MLKKGKVLFLIIIIQIFFVSTLRAQDESTKPDDKQTLAEENKEENNKGKPDIKEKTKQEIRGMITEIAENGTYLKIGEKKIITSKQFLNDSFLAVGDNVEIMGEETPDGLKALDFKYIYEESNDTSVLDEDLFTPGEFDIRIKENK
jgi:hypothetical protein